MTKLNYIEQTDPRLDYVTSLATAGRTTYVPSSDNIVCVKLAQDVLTLRKEVAFLEHRVEKLDALEAAGVDNWDGYADAMEDIDDET